MHGAHVNDGAAAPRVPHQGQTSFRREECAVKMDSQNALPLIEAEFFHRTHNLGAGIADENVDAAEPGSHRRDGLADAFLNRHVHGQRDGLAA